MSYETAQKRYFESEGVEPGSRWVELQLRGINEPRAVRTHILEMGSGEPLLFVHGGGGLAAAWAPLMARLPGHRLIAPDRPGCGMSVGFDYRGVDFRAHAVAWMERIYEACGLERAVIVANSMGARWATWFALEHPERVSGMALLGIPALILDTSAPVPMRLLGRPVVGRLMMALEPPGPKTARRLWSRIGHDPNQMSSEVLALTEELGRQPGYALTWRTLIGAVTTLRGARPGLSLDAGQLGRLACPITLAIGDRDPFGSVEVGRRAVEAMGDGHLEIAGTGHLPWLDEPERYASAVSELIARTANAAPRSVPA